MGLIYFLIFIIILIISIPLLLLSGAFYFTSVSLDLLDISYSLGFLLALLVIISSFINIPLGKKRAVRLVETRHLGIFPRTVWRSQGVSINIGGALIPLFVAGYFLSYIPTYPTLISVLIVSFFAFITSSYVEKRGVLVLIFLPVLFAVSCALFLAPEYARETAFVGGVLGVLIGGDLLHLPQILLKKGGGIVIGGGGIFDAIFLTGIISAIIASL